MLHAPDGFTDVELIGRGATSWVYKATETATGRVVALKRLARHLVRDAEALARFRREIAALARLRHPGIAAVYEVITWDRDPTVVMEYLPGEDLKERIARLGHLPADEVERIARDLFEILGFAHGAGIVHRDVKPQNIRRLPDGRIVLLDFGSARLDASSQLTTTGATVGTPEYMAPELFAGSAYDPRGDLYGAGATLYECLTGAPPQSADSLAELAYKRTTEDIGPVEAAAPFVPRHLALVVNRCLERAPEDRFASAPLATWALDHVREHEAFLARRAAHPPCLHCGRAIARESTACSGCGSERPFTYADGAFHVVVRSLRDPVALLEHVTAQFPERRGYFGVRGFARRCAALAFGPQRYVSFVDEADAGRIVEQLRGQGVRAEARRERAIGPVSLLSAVALGAWALHAWSVTLALLGVLGVWLLDRALSFRQARQGFLADTRVFALTYPATHAFFLFVLGIGFLWWRLDPMQGELHWVGLWGPVDESNLYTGLMLAGLAVTLPLYLFRFGRVGPRLGVQPGPGHALAATLCMGRTGALLKARRSSGMGRLASQGALLLAAEAVVLGALVANAYELQTWARREVAAVREAARSVSEMIARARSPEVEEVMPPSTLRPAPLRNHPPCTGSIGEWCPDVARLASHLPVGDDEEELTLLDRARGRRPLLGFVPQDLTLADLARPATIFVPSLVVLCVLALVLVRYRRMLRDGDRIMLRFERQSRGESRCPPATRLVHLGAGDAALASHDRFVGSAAQRCANLVPLLSAHQAFELQGRLLGLPRRQGGGDAGPSEVARCVLETDPELSTRLEFLALEGRMEAAAARTWLETLDAGARGRA